MELTLIIIKGTGNSTITTNTKTNKDGSFKRLCITGRIKDLKGYKTTDNVDLSEQIVKSELTTTLLIDDKEIADDIEYQCGMAFMERGLANNNNAVLELIVDTDLINVTETNILVKQISNITLNKDVQIGDTSNHVLKKLAKAKQVNSAKRTVGNITARLARPQPKQQPQTNANKTNKPVIKNSKFSGFKAIKKYF